MVAAKNRASLHSVQCLVSRGRARHGDACRHERGLARTSATLGACPRFIYYAAAALQLLQPYPPGRSVARPSPRAICGRASHLRCNTMHRQQRLVL